MRPILDIPTTADTQQSQPGQAVRSTPPRSGLVQHAVERTAFPHRMTQTTESPALTIEAADPIGDIARELIRALCSEMSERYGAPPSPFSVSEAAMPRTVFLVARLSGQPVGCGALRRFDDHTAEVKRMYVAPAGRRQGIARRILVDLERHAHESGYRAVRLETGDRQPEAQRLYESLGYRHIPAFGPYVGNPTSVCYEKIFHDTTHAA